MSYRPDEHGPEPETMEVAFGLPNTDRAYWVRVLSSHEENAGNPDPLSVWQTVCVIDQWVITNDDDQPIHHPSEAMEEAALEALQIEYHVERGF